MRWSLSCVATLFLGWLAGEAAGADVAAAGLRDLFLAAAEEEQEQPWLRIRAGGHTASVRALAFLPDSARLCSAGLDKEVHVWDLRAALRDLGVVFLRERTIRWQIARGPRGMIYAMDAAPSDGLLAFGGYGAMGQKGEILLVDAATGELKQVLAEHGETVYSLGFSADGNRLASIDLAGKAVLWNRGDWKPRVLDQADSEKYGQEVAELIARQPARIRRIAVDGNDWVFVPALASGADEPRLRWKLSRVRLAGAAERETLGTVHFGQVTALTATRDGSRLASADIEGNLYLWDLRQGAAAVRLEPGAAVASLAFSPDGQKLAVGTAVPPGRTTSQLQIWDTASRTVLVRRDLADHVFACAFSPDGVKLAYSGGQRHEVFVRPLDGPGGEVALEGTTRRVLKAAFANSEPYYRVAFGTRYADGGYNDYAGLDETFDPLRLELGASEPLDAADFLSAEWMQGDWRAKWKGPRELGLSRGGVPKGRIRLPEIDGDPRCYCWVPDREGRPFAIAVGSDVQNSIYVFKLVEEGDCPILRHFRGHQDYVASVGVSRDLRYLVSGSADGTVRFWSLSNLALGAAGMGRWGAQFEIRQGRLVIADLDEAGPLLRRGLRVEDELAEIRWKEEGAAEAIRSATEPEEVLRRLGELPWTAQVVFQTRRGGQDQPPFQRVPAWEPLATLFVGSDREWAFWTPEGYYDASVNGHTRFGWQVNRGLQSLPDSYGAEQFRKRLERPDVMARLLEDGCLEGALRQAAARPPWESHQVLEASIAASPRVEIVAPRPNSRVAGEVTTVTARITMPAGAELSRADAFANGVFAGGSSRLSQREIEGGREVTVAWEAALPSDPRQQILVIAATDEGLDHSAHVDVDRQDPPKRKPAMHLVALGINDYADPGVRRLNYSVADAEAIAARMQSSAADLYQMARPVVLTNDRVTPEDWRAALEELKRELSQRATADDLVVVFLSGHGIVDPAGDEYYYVGHHARLDAVAGKDYSDCLSWDDFKLLGDLPCRKLVLLDTCHSGAIRPLQPRGLKAAARALHEELIFTVAASEGGKGAAEHPDWGHGAFTTCLLEGLKGKADDSHDGLVSLSEVTRYVTRSVPELTGGIQYPTFGPKEIVEHILLPLTRSERPAAGQ